MKHLKRLAFLALAAMMLLACASCGATGQTQKEPQGNLSADGEDVLIAYSCVADGEQAAWAGELRTALEDMCAEQGWTLSVRSAEGIPANQGAQVTELLAEDPDYFILFAGDSLMADDWVKEIFGAGVPVIMAGIDASPAMQSSVSAFVGPDQEAIAAQLAANLIWDNGADAGLNIACISGNEPQQDYILREQGYEKTIGHFSNYTILATEYAGASRDKAKEIMETYIQNYGDKLDVVMCYDDEFAMGAIEVLQQHEMLDQVKVYSITGSDEAIQAVKDGTLTETVINDAHQIADGCAQVIQGLMTGTIPVHYNYTTPTYIDSENASDYVGKGAF